MKAQEEKKEEIKELQKAVWRNQSTGEQLKKNYFETNEKLTWKEKDFLSNEQYEERFLAFLNGRRSGNYEYLKNEQLKLKIRKKKIIKV